MFFSYPASANAENWLHDCLVEMISSIHARIDSGQKALKWPMCVPTAHRAKIESRHGLKKRLNTYRLRVQKLKLIERQQILKCLMDQNKIAALVSRQTECQCLAELPKPIHSPVNDLFNFAYDLLTDLGVRHRHYRKIYDAIENHVCPFCACEYFDAPATNAAGSPQRKKHISEDLDHYLPRSQYIFAAANLNNLSPMGGRCNAYKGGQDVLRDTKTKRRRAFDPYGGGSISLSLNRSKPFMGTDGKKPKWQIEFLPDSPECKTWDDVFSFKERLQTDVLDPLYETWIGNFASVFAKRNSTAKVTNQRIVAALKSEAEDEGIKGMNGRDFLRSHVLMMLHHHCSKRNTRLLRFIKDAIKLAVPPKKVT